MNKKDPRGRRERRANPARWFKVDGAIGQGPNVVGLPDGVCVYGEVENIIVITYPSDSKPREIMEMLKGAREVVTQAGIDKSVIVVPDAVKFLKLRPLSAEETAKIEQAHRNAQTRREAQQKKQQGTLH